MTTTHDAASPGHPTGAAGAELRTELILRAVELVPAGRVASYGDIAAVVGTGPRQVGATMAHWGSSVAWWRVTNAAGSLPAHLLDEATAQWREEGITLSPSGRACRIARHRVDLDELAACWQQAVEGMEKGPGSELPRPRS